MLCNGMLNNYDTDKILLDVSLHNGVPKNFLSIKDKSFNDWEIPPWELFIFKDRILGQGSFSKVYLSKWRETFVVAKVIDPEISLNKKELILKEIEIMTKLHHPNIVQFLGYIDEPFIIVLEYIPNNSLSEHIGSLSKNNKFNITLDILRGLAYLHNRKPYSLIHRDIKPTNVILTKSKFAKIADFGLSTFYTNFKLDNNETFPSLDLTGDVGTERYMAPETISKVYDNKVDIYACGILIYEMYENKKYHKGQKIKWYWTPRYIRDIVDKFMINSDPEERLSALELLKMFNKYI